MTIASPTGAPRISIVVAMDRNRLIGRDGGLPWRLPADLKRFRRLTMGRPVVMGRVTHQSIGRVLDGRLNVIVSRDPEFTVPGAVVAPDWQAALHACRPAPEAMIIGGANLYETALAHAHRIHATLVDAAFEGDRHFPEISDAVWYPTAVEVAHDDSVPFAYRYMTYERR